MNYDNLSPEQIQDFITAMLSGSRPELPPAASAAVAADTVSTALAIEAVHAARDAEQDILRGDKRAIAAIHLASTVGTPDAERRVRLMRQLRVSLAELKDLIADVMEEGIESFQDEEDDDEGQGGAAEFDISSLFPQGFPSHSGIYGSAA